MNNNDINYQIKLIDDNHYLKEKMGFLLELKKEYNEKISVYFKVDSPASLISNFFLSPKTEMLKYTYAINQYKKKIGDIHSKFEVFQKGFESYLKDRTRSNYELLKGFHKDIKSISIDYSRYNPYIQRLRRRLSTENNKDMKVLEGESRQLNYEIKGVKYIVDDMMQTVVLFETQGLYNGKDYLKHSDYKKEMKGICESFIEAKKENLNNKEYGYSDEDIKFIKMDILYYENKNKEYLKFIEMVDSVSKNQKSKKHISELSQTNAMDNSQLDILANLIANSKIVSLNVIVKDKKMGSAVTEFLFPNQQIV
ncbi:hypothetical protein [Providencia rettgeri]|uniref:hypothetical protein n=1 Tax=Providencia rettgeri TaxID=587 RepID=UPI00235EC494|nr:hypothetical protein [Providencia rettgeri]